LRSFAAFVQRGLGEWEKLKDYLEEREYEISDRRYIYGLIGAIEGFSSMSKTLTDTDSIPEEILIKFINDLNNIVGDEFKPVFVAKETYLHGDDISSPTMEHDNPNEDTRSPISSKDEWRLAATNYIQGNVTNKKIKRRLLPCCETNH